jgi:hypothetical protein
LGRGDVGVAARVVAAAALGKAAAVERACHRRLGFQRRVEVGDCRWEVAHLEMQEAADVERVAVAGTQPQRLVAIRHGLRQLLGGHSRATSRGPSRHALRLEAHRLVEILDGAIEIALDPIGDAAVVEGFAMVGLQLDRLIIVFDGAVDVALAPMRIGPVVEGVFVVGPEPDRLIDVLDGAVVVAAFRIGDAAVVEGGGTVGRFLLARLNERRATGNRAIRIGVVAPAPLFIAGLPCRRAGSRNERSEHERDPAPPGRPPGLDRGSHAGLCPALPPLAEQAHQARQQQGSADRQPGRQQPG